MSRSNNTSVEVGTQAPDFALPSTTGEDIGLSDYRGKSNVLLAFFPLAFSRVCTTEFCDFSENLDDFDSCGTKVLGISVDAVPSLQAFREQCGIKVDLLSDFKREVSRLYGILWEDHFFSNRAYFVVDSDGVLRWAHVEENPGFKRGNRELLGVLKGIGS